MLSEIISLDRRSISLFSFLNFAILVSISDFVNSLTSPVASLSYAKVSTSAIASDADNGVSPELLGDAGLSGLTLFRVLIS